MVELGCWEPALWVMALSSLSDGCSSAMPPRPELWADAPWVAGETVINHPDDHVMYVHPEGQELGAVTQSLAHLGKASGDLHYLGEG